MTNQPTNRTHPRLLSPLLPHPTLFAPWFGAHFSIPSPGLALGAGTAQGEDCFDARAKVKAPEPNSAWALRQAVAGSTQLRHSEEEEGESESEEESEAKSVGAGAEQRLTQAFKSGAAVGEKPGGIQE